MPPNKGNVSPPRLIKMQSECMVKITLPQLFTAIGEYFGIEGGGEMEWGDCILQD